MSDKTKRQLALEWWNGLIKEQKEAILNHPRSFNKTIIWNMERIPDMLTGREIEILYDEFKN